MQVGSHDIKRFLTNGVAALGRGLTFLVPRTLSEAELAARSERFFVLRLVAILAAAGTVGSVGVMQVRRSSAGIRTAYELVQANDALREEIEANRHLEAQLVGLKNPNDLRREAQDVWEMHVPGADEQVEVD